MKVWKVDVWIKLKKNGRWENWQDEFVACETIEEAISKAKAKQQEDWEPRAIEVEVRSACLEVETTVEEAS